MTWVFPDMVVTDSGGRTPDGVKVYRVSKRYPDHLSIIGSSFREHPHVATMTAFFPMRNGLWIKNSTVRRKGMEALKERMLEWEKEQEEGRGWRMTR